MTARSRIGGRNSGRERGGALLLVLWMAAALAAIGLSVATTVRTEVDHTSTVADGLRAQYLASGSLDRFIQWMRWGARNQPDGSVRFWDRRKTLFPMTYATGDVLVQMIPETAKLDVNRVRPEDLVALITVISGDAARAREIAAAIVDWRGRPVDGMEGYYLTQGPSFQPRHASLQEIEELLFVRGMTPDLFYGNYVEDAQGRLYARGGLRDCLSVWGSVGQVDANGASPALLEAIGLTQDQVSLVVERRQAQPFANINELRELGIPINRLNLNQSSMWTVRATARLRLADGSPSDVVRSAAAVVKYWDDPTQVHASQVQVVRYYQDAWSEFAVKPSPVPGVPPGAFVQ